MSDDLVKRLRDLAQAKHDDLSVGDEAAARIADFEAALQDMAKHVWRGDWDKLKPQTRALLGETK